MRIIFSIFVMALLLNLQSCTSCTDYPCGGSSPIVVEFSGYIGNEEILIESYYKNGQFDSLIESRTENVNLSSSNTWVAHFVSPDYDYRLSITSDGNQFSITDLDVNENVTQRKCGRVRTLEQLICPWNDFKVTGSKATKVNDGQILVSK